ncbi:hypothetical protein Chls_012 [Chlamydia suis]|uniref:Uncharacterized protein n=1 Tax=Chlamydia suis TaxID=83559 RepID=A0ABX6IS31_9CHLA|nr:hypothetical protein Chls_012 [Chlamydia suis]
MPISGITVSRTKAFFKKKKPFSYTIILVPLYLPSLIFMPCQKILFFNYSY